MAAKNAAAPIRTLKPTTRDSPTVVLARKLKVCSNSIGESNVALTARQAQIAMIVEVHGRKEISKRANDVVRLMTFRVNRKRSFHQDNRRQGYR